VPGLPLRWPNKTLIFAFYCAGSFYQRFINPQNIHSKNKKTHIRVFNKTKPISNMKKLLLAFAMISFTFAAYSAENQAVLEFRKIFWGSSKDSIYRDGKKLEFVKDKNALIKNAYTLTNDDMTIGAVKLDRVLYIFNDDNRFYRVFVQGPVDETEQMKFILTYKFGDFRNESFVDDSHIMQWLVKDVTFTLKEVSKSRFELTIESNWRASEDYKKNTSVDDF
jgi:hypothetical protein